MYLLNVGKKRGRVINKINNFVDRGSKKITHHCSSVTK